MLRVYEYSKCSTCRKALAFLDKHGLEYEKVPIVDKPPTKGELQAAAAKVGLKKLFNTSGELYREMRISERLPKLTEAEAIDLLSKHGKLVKRPFVPQHALVGFDEAAWKTALLK